MYNPESGYLCFAEALNYLKRSRPVARASWKTSCLWLTGNKIVITQWDSQTLSPWTPTSEDVLAEDWVHIIPPSTQ